MAGNDLIWVLRDTCDEYLNNVSEESIYSDENRRFAKIANSDQEIQLEQITKKQLKERKNRSTQKVSDATSITIDESTDDDVIVLSSPVVEIKKTKQVHNKNIFVASKRRYTLDTENAKDAGKQAAHRRQARLKEEELKRIKRYTPAQIKSYYEGYDLVRRVLNFNQKQEKAVKKIGDTDSSQPSVAPVGVSMNLLSKNEANSFSSPKTIQPDLDRIFSNFVPILPFFGNSDKKVSSSYDEPMTIKNAITPVKQAPRSGDKQLSEVALLKKAITAGKQAARRGYKRPSEFTLQQRSQYTNAQIKAYLESYDRKVAMYSPEELQINKEREAFMEAERKKKRRSSEVELKNKKQYTSEQTKAYLEEYDASVCNFIEEHLIENLENIFEEIENFTNNDFINSNNMQRLSPTSLQNGTHYPNDDTSTLEEKNNSCEFSDKINPFIDDPSLATSLLTPQDSSNNIERLLQIHLMDRLSENEGNSFALSETIQPDFDQLFAGAANIHPTLNNSNIKSENTLFNLMNYIPGDDALKTVFTKELGITQPGFYQKEINHTNSNDTRPCVEDSYCASTAEIKDNSCGFFEEIEAFLDDPNATISVFTPQRRSFHS